MEAHKKAHVNIQTPRCVGRVANKTLYDKQ